MIEVTNRSASPAHYLIHTADWSLTADFGVTFHDDLQPGSCRPWVAIERPEVTVPGGGTLRYRFEVSVPADAPNGECRFALMIEGAEPSIARSNGLDLPVTGRIGVIVYLVIGDGAPDLEILGPKITTLNGQQVPSLRVHNKGNAHGRMSGFLTGTRCEGHRVRLHSLQFSHSAARRARDLFDPVDAQPRSSDAYLPGHGEGHHRMGHAQN